MFTGIIEEVGKIQEIRRQGPSVHLVVQAKKILEDIHVGDSIAVNGICLTATAFTEAGFSADVMHETMSRTSLGNLRKGSSVNLERAMQMNGRFGGHIVSGHIDGTGVIEKIEKDSIAVWYTIRADRRILRYIVEKGSVALDGISLTVASVSAEHFRVSVIPHTQGHTALSEKKVKDIVNIENDCVGKYIEKFLCEEKGTTGITREFLAKYGY